MRLFRSSPRFLLFPLLLVLFCMSCDILRNRPFELLSCSPAEGRLEALPERILLEFSLEVQVPSAQANIALSCDGRPMPSRVTVQGSMVVLHPLLPLEEGGLYRIMVSDDLKAMDSQRLARPFSRSFFFFDSAAPYLRLLGQELPMAQLDQIILEFSGALDEDSARAGIMLYPDSSFLRSQEVLPDGRSRYCLTPLYPWEQGSSYKILLSPFLRSQEGDLLGEEITLHFLQDEAPRIVQSLELAVRNGPVVHTLLASELAAQALVPTSTDPLVLSGLAPSAELILVWDEEVLLADMDPLLKLDGKALIRESASLESGATRAPRGVWTVPRSSPWGTSALLSLDPRLFSDTPELLQPLDLLLVFDDPASRPPRVDAVRVLFFEGDEIVDSVVYRLEDALSFFLPDPLYYPPDEPRPFAVEFYLDTPPGCEIDFFWFLQNALMRVDSASLGLSFIRASCTEFSAALPAEGLEEHWRCEFGALLTNRIGSGLVRIEVAAATAPQASCNGMEGFLLTLCK